MSWMSAEIKLSQSTAIRLEQARGKGMPEEEILKAIQAKDVSAFDAVSEEEYRYNEFFSYADEHGENLEAAVKMGTGLPLTHVVDSESGWKRPLKCSQRKISRWVKESSPDYS